MNVLKVLVKEFLIHLLLTNKRVCGRIPHSFSPDAKVSFGRILVCLFH